MNPADAADLIRQALWTAFWASLPLLAVGLVIGVIVSLVQVLTSIQDPGFSAVPRLIAFLGAAVVFLPWITARLMTYTSALLGDFTRYCR